MNNDYWFLDPLTYRREVSKKNPLPNGQRIHDVKQS